MSSQLLEDFSVERELFQEVWSVLEMALGQLRMVFSPVVSVTRKVFR